MEQEKMKPQSIEERGTEETRKQSDGLHYSVMPSLHTVDEIAKFVAGCRLCVEKEHLMMLVCTQGLQKEIKKRKPYHGWSFSSEASQ